MASPRNDLTRTVLGVIFIVALMVASLWTLSAFLGAIVWATMIVVATWPIMLWVQARLGKRRGLAVAAMTLTLLLLLIAPMATVVWTVAANVDEIAGWSQSLKALHVPPAPEWVGKLPGVGPKAAEKWNEVAATAPEELAQKAAPYVGAVVRWLAGKAGGLGMAMFQFLLTVIVSAVLYSNGEIAAQGVLRFARRLAGDRGDEVVRLAGNAVRGVALGVIVTALLQSTLAGLGLFVARVPHALVLTAVVFALCIAQLGPFLVMLPVAIWMYATHHPVAATFFLLWAILVGIMDNFVRPVLIKKGADLPLLLIFAGVIGGLIAFGLLGIFAGPIILAVTYKLLSAWVETGEAEAADKPPAAAQAAPAPPPAG